MYIEAVTQGANDFDIMGVDGQAGIQGEEDDALYDEAVRFVTESRKASISSVQRKLRIGYNRAARMIESMEAAGVVSGMSANGSREVIAPTPYD
jgi:S-DNA-T family DNA segregation ATPase FtsK/SpoIIIE